MSRFLKTIVGNLYETQYKISVRIAVLAYSVDSRKNINIAAPIKVIYLEC